MAGSTITYPLNGATNWENFPDIVQKMQAGFMNLNLTHFGDTSEPQIAAGSSLDVNGTPVVFSSAESFTGWSGISSGQIVYMKVVVSGSSATAAFTTTAPTWSDSKNGYYNGNDRYIGYLFKGGVSVYALKRLYWGVGDQGPKDDALSALDPFTRVITVEEAVSARDVIVMNFDRGKYYKADTSWDPKKGTAVEVDSTNGINPGYVRYVRLGSNKILMGYWAVTAAEWKAVVITTDEDGDVTVGTPGTILSSAPDTAISFFEVDTDKFVVVYKDNSTGDAKAICFTISGTTIGTPGSIFTLFSAADVKGNYISGCKLADGYFVAVYVSASDDDSVKDVCSLSGTTISRVGSQEKLASTSDAIWVCRVKDNVVAVAHQYQEAGAFCRLTLYAVDPSTGNWASCNSYDIYLPDVSSYDGIDYFGMVTLTDNFFVFGLSGGTWRHHLVGVANMYSGSNDGTNDNEELDALWGINLYLYGGNLNAVASMGIPFVVVGQGRENFGAQVIHFQKGKVGFRRIETITAAVTSGAFPILLEKDRGLFLWNGGGGSYDWDIQAMELYPKVIGFAESACTASGDLRVRFGGIMGGFSGLTPEADYYLQDDGSISTDMATGLVKVGRAVSTTELRIEIEDPW